MLNLFRKDTLTPADGTHLQGSAVHSGYHSHLPDC